MNSFNKILYTLGLASVIAIVPAEAQSILPTGAQPMIVTPHNQSVSYSERTLCLNVEANVDYEVTSDASWVTIRRSSGNRVYLHVDTNYDGEARTANITFANSEKSISQTLVITQAADGSVETIPTDNRIYPSTASASSYQNGEGIEKSYDDSYSTLYHSSYSGSVSESNPVTLTYNFKNVDCINYVTYVPRNSGGDNGKFGKVEVYVKTNGNDETLWGSYDWNYGSTSQTITFGENGLVNPQYVKFVVLTGSGGFASCAEMEFYANANDDQAAEFDIFGDDLYSTLREGVTQDDIDRLTNPFVKSMATKLFNGTYDKAYRVAEFPCLMEVNTLADSWNAPGKLYDQMAGVTGITFGPGTYMVVVSGLPDGKSATLKLCAWYNGKVGSNFDGGNPQTTSFALKNGINVIKYDPATSLSYEGTYCSDYDALGYIDYSDTEDPENYPNLKVHFVNGVVNGYLSPDKTNEEMHELTANAKNWTMDVVGKKVHSVWTAAGLHKYCKDSSGNAIGYRQYMNVLDSLVTWEHRHLGLEKYNRIPTNRTFAYANYTYYMFQGSLGVSFHVDQESRVLNCKTLMYNDDDAVWGLSHEWGHQHQMQPYMCWAGLSEVSNNLFSYYNIMHMGYTRSDKTSSWDTARDHFINKKDAFVPTCDSDAPYYERENAVSIASNYSYSPKLQALCQEMSNYTSSIPAASEDAAHAVAISEVGVGEMLAPFIMLQNYALITLNKPGFGPDMFEALRQNDDENGSQIEKQGEVDKYELIASAQNYNKNGKLAVLKEKYPNSCWVTDKYITEDHCSRYDNSAPYIFNYIRKVSRLYGYNLMPYFDEWGFLRRVAVVVGDYGNKPILITQEMYDEFKTDMDALVTSGELKEMPEGMVSAISNTRQLNESNGTIMYPTPTIPN